MLTKLTDTSAATSLGLAAGHKLMSVASGNWKNRRIALFMSAPNTISLSWSDSPYVGWKPPVAVVTDAADEVFDAIVDANGNLVIAYTDQATAHLITRRLTIGASGWTVGSKVTVYDSALGYVPNLALTSDGTYWLAWRQTIVPSSWIYVKSSVDGGLTWGSGSSDNGTQVSSAATFVWPRLLADNSTLYLFIAYGNDRLVVRSRGISGGAWSAESAVIASASVGSEFDVALTDSGGLALLICDALPRYREFDGFTWGAVTTLDTRPAISPQLLFRQGNPVAVFLGGLGPHQFALLQSARVGGAFTPTNFVDRRSKTFDSVQLFHAASLSYHDVTAVAADSNSGDVFHPVSGATLASVGDRMYVGLSDPFRFLTVLQLTVGAGGTVSYSYWDGSGWKSFTPISGGSNLGNTTNQLALWSDYSAVPIDWQKTTINGQYLFWLKVECTAAYSSAPNAYQVTALSELKQVSVRR